MRTQVSSLLRSELSALQTGSNLDAVRALATRIYELQVQQDNKRDAEAGELTTSCRACVDSMNFMSQSVPSETRILVSLICLLSIL
jgi:hypothetical protein